MSRSTHVTAGVPDAQRVFRLFIPLLVCFLCIIQQGMSVMTSTAVLVPSEEFKTTTWTHEVTKTKGI